MRVSTSPVFCHIRVRKYVLKGREKNVRRGENGSDGGTTYTRGPEGIYLQAHDLRRVICYTPSPHHTPSRRATAGGREDQQTRMALWGYPAPLCPSRGGWPPSAKHGPIRENHQAKAAMEAGDVYACATGGGSEQVQRT